jgi:hypothetical protein
LKIKKATFNFHLLIHLQPGQITLEQQPIFLKAKFVLILPVFSKEKYWLKVLFPLINQ